MVLFFKCLNRDDLQKCASLIDGGSIVVFPTDTVYGIGCDPLNDSSVLNLYKIKNRPLEKHLPILTNSVSNLADMVELTYNAKKLINCFWPGPLTLILKVKDNSIIAHKYAFDKTIAIRIPNNKCTLDLIQMTKNKLLVGTSANLSGQSHFSNINDLLKTDLKGYDAIVIKEEGDEAESFGELQTYLNSNTEKVTKKNNEYSSIINQDNPIPPVSTIVDLSDTNTINTWPKIIREGIISKEKIFSSLEKREK
ncbi:MAG TPA: L-threonylcarbamoyladenylate synthase [Candidatus Nitrosocosmicus sp.]|nr:L-threonylcarbamoyladenylate synthase [Candidatus Nitrosocosmicus sp.]